MLNPLSFPDVVLAGPSAAAQRLRLQIDRVAPHYRTALLVGEAGCLKEEVARALRARSPLREHGFVVHSAATYGAAVWDTGQPVTVYLTGLPDFGPEQQKALLQRLRQGLRSGQADFRLICSSDVAPRGLVAAGRLCPELYGWMSAVEIRIAPLRERLEDLPALLGDVQVHPETMARLGEHHWPGNLRELCEVMEHGRERAGSEAIMPEHLPSLSAMPRRAEQDMRLESVLRRHVHCVLEACEGNKLRAAERLGISRSTLYRMLDAN